ncbi:DUF4934 domain-containing protein [Parabacteroides johnsonii]|uniref:DUF4934 domain-containing protein n=1 Tax=Parabacteroides johnsonii TaxID=387661 RepID=UPI0018998164|nr:DUF4934 domain-containing protein [Parabacteroides johnsonii]
MKNCVYQFAMSACLFLAACSGGGTKVAKLEVIPLGAAFDNQTELKTSDCFKKIRYVALETTDSCLVDKGASVTILNDWLVVVSGRNCQLFDKETGRFVRTVGHVGEDPEGCSTVHGGWQNPYTGKLSFAGWKGSFVMYGADGRFDRTWTPPIVSGAFPNISAFTYLDAEVIAGYYSASDSLPARVALFRGNEIIRVDSLLMGQSEENGVAGVNDIAMISVLKDGGSGVVLIKGKDGRSAIYSLGNTYFWNIDKELYFHHSYNDTIYQISAVKGLQPVRVLDLGAYGWAYNERFEDKKDAIYPTKFMENKDVIFFRFMTNVYNDKQKTYNALYRKADGTVKVCLFDERIIDDMNGFLPLQPISVSSSGEFAAILPSEEVVSWFEDNAGKMDIPSEVAALKKVGEEDNPVVAIME